MRCPITCSSILLARQCCSHFGIKLCLIKWLIWVSYGGIWFFVILASVPQIFVEKCGIVETLLSWVEVKRIMELKKTDGRMRQNVNIPKLVDAYDGGGKNSDNCTLILTEGDSAMPLVLAGVSEVGRDRYGVFPLTGKLLNVRVASHKQIKENVAIRNIMQIFGLQQDKHCDSVEGLRYGSLMIMTDQDYDGSHIKGLLINLFHCFWPSLLKLNSFVFDFITPIIKASHKNGKVISFYTMPEYKAWKESLNGHAASSWTIKYYKGLGTSAPEEGREYFQQLSEHKRTFVWAGEQDGEAIELAFCKNMEEKRKWLLQFEVFEFSGYVSKHSAYHHAEQSLNNTLVGMARDFVGSNNINLFQPKGQFGTRNKGGKDAASGRYINTCLSPLTRFLFPKDDDLLLDYLVEDGKSVEPAWYMPIIPVVLVNGSEGIGKGWSSKVPKYNPRDVLQMSDNC